jgi:hypothetical protein
MNQILRFVKKNFLNRFPTALPRGMTAFQTWSQDIIDTYQLPNNDSIRFMLGAIILQLGPTSANLPKRYFGLCGYTAASKEIAHATLTALKEKQADEEKARVDAEKAAASATALAAAQSNVTPIKATSPEATITSIGTASSVTPPPQTPAS